MIWAMRQLYRRVMAMHTFIKEEKFMGSWKVFKSKNIRCSRSKDPHGCSNLISSSYTCQLISRPYSENCTHCEVCINNAGTIQWVKSDAESTWLHFLSKYNHDDAFFFKAKTITNFLISNRICYLQLGLPCLGAQELPPSNHI